MIRGERTAPRKGIGFARLSWGKRETSRVLATTIVDCITKLHRSTGAVCCYMNGSSIGDNSGGTTGQAHNRGGTHRHINAGDNECCL